jgi:hypothetical protein
MRLQKKNPEGGKVANAYNTRVGSFFVLFYYLNYNIGPRIK